MKQFTFFCLSITIIFISYSALAQQSTLLPYERNDFALSVKSTDIIWERGEIVYLFRVEREGTTSSEIKNLVIETNIGEIDFSGSTITDSTAERFANGYLESSDETDIVIISRATATIGGRRFDVTEKIKTEQSSTVSLLKKSSFNGVTEDSFMFIWQIDANYDSDDFSKQVYTFCVDPKYFLDQDFSVLENLTVSTNVGIIKFPGQKIVKPLKTGFLIGTLTTSETLQDIRIFAATAQIDGVPYDLTKNFRANDFSQITSIEIASPETDKCPSKTLDLNLYQGKFVNLECGDYCFAEILVNNQNTYFGYSKSVSYFFQNERNYGHEIKFLVKKSQTTRFYPDGETDGETECIPDFELITQFFVVK
ncbi:MAG: hypothetical protein LBU69_00740 [Deltaproteobacteria bacterium]|jgi:hypothetical protein|nr:hypothetical protein [Deltaproteobacteria bacterium]